MHIQLSADPSLVWISDPTDSSNLASECLSRVISWLTFANRNHVQMYVDYNAIIELYSEDLVPNDNHISSIINKIGYEGVINAKELAKLINELVIASCDMPEPVEKIANFTSLGIDFSASISNESKRKLSENSFLNYCLLWGTSQVELSYVFPRISEEKVTTRNEIQVDIFETDVQRVFDESTIGVEVPVFGTDAGLYASLNPHEIWKAAVDGHILEEAIRSLAFNKDIAHIALKSFSFGSSFFETAKKNGGISGSISSVLMNKIYEILTGSDGVVISPFRTSSNSSAPVRTRASDNAEARRVHLTKCHEGYRLLFWELDDGSLEFANVGPKFEEKIES